MGLFSARGFNQSFQSGFAQGLQMLMQQKSEDLQRELEGQRAKQQKEQFDQQMATTREQFDREMFFKENRAQKADVVSEIERLTMQNNRSEDVSFRNASAVEERMSREAQQRTADEQLALQREKVGIDRTEADARIGELGRRLQPIGSLAEALNKQIGAMIFDPTDTQETVDLKSKTLVTGQQVKASGSAAENETKRTGIEGQKLEMMRQDRDRAAVESLWSKVGDERDKLRTAYERARGQRLDSQLKVLENLATNALDENERRRYLSVISDLTSAKSVEDQNAASDKYAAEVMMNRIKSDPAWKTLVAGLEEPLREKFMSEFSKSAEVKAEAPKTERRADDSNIDTSDLDERAQVKLMTMPTSQRKSAIPTLKKESEERRGIYEIQIGDNAWKVKAPGDDIGAGDIASAIFRGRKTGTFKEFASSADAKEKMVESYLRLYRKGRGKGWATTFEKAMNNEAFRSEIVKDAWVSWGGLK